MSFTLEHFYKSQKAEELSINNYPGVDVSKNPNLTEQYINNNLRLLHKNVVKPILNAFGSGNIRITSAYRCMELNEKLTPPGSPNSQHVFGLAVDMVCRGKSSADLFNWCYINLPNGWNQLIWEYPENGDYVLGANESSSWLHVSWAENYNSNKTSVITADENIHELYKTNYVYTERRGNATHKIKLAELADSNSSFN